MKSIFSFRSNFVIISFYQVGSKNGLFGGSTMMNETAVILLVPNRLAGRDRMFFQKPEQIDMIYVL